MDGKDALRIEKLKAFGAAYMELARTAEAILMIQQVREELPEEFGDDVQLGKFIAGMRKAKEAVEELAKSESWDPKQTAFHEKMCKGCDDWIQFFHDHPLLGEFMTVNEVVEALGARAFELGKKTIELASELNILL